MGNYGGPGTPNWSPHISFGGQAQGPQYKLPLRLGPLGHIDATNIFDEKMTERAEFKYNGSTGGDRWKRRLEGYLIPRVPALKELFEYIEHMPDGVIVTAQLIQAAVGQWMTPYQQDNLNRALYGFLAGCFTGDADTVFKGARMLQGFDAWKRMIRSIDHGRTLRLDVLRDETKVLHLKPFRSLEAVNIGITEFENKHQEFIEAGGAPVADREKKDDLFKMLPEKLREDFMWRMHDIPDYIQFRETVRSQVSRILTNRRKSGGPVGNVEEGTNADDLNNIDNEEDLVLAFRDRKRTTPGGPRAPAPKRVARSTTSNFGSNNEKKALKCPNCGEDHLMRDCKLPIKSLAERVCWKCGKKGHNSSECRSKKNGVNAVTENEGCNNDDMPCFGLDLSEFAEQSCNAVTWEEPTKTTRGRPMPHGNTFGDVLLTNGFGVLEESNNTSKRTKNQIGRAHV